MRKIHLIITLFLLLTLVTSCRKEQVTPFESLYIKYNIDGKEYSYSGNEFSSAPYFTTSFGGGGEFPVQDSIWISFGSHFMSSMYEGNIDIGFDIDTYVSKAELDSIVNQRKGHEYMLDILKPRKIDFYPSKVINNSPKIGVIYIDSDNIAWRTFSNSKRSLIDPLDHRFYYEIIESEEYITADQDTSILVTANFSFVAYSEDGDSLTITDGEIKSLYEWYHLFWN